MVRFAHTVFALPFALTAMSVAQYYRDGSIFPDLGTLLLIVLACYAARTAAMTFNRIADREIDALNPRTASRELVTGQLSMQFAWSFLIIHCLIFVAAAGGLNRFAFVLSPVCLFVLLGYSFTKRFTFLSHFALGAALGLAPIGAWIAIAGKGVLEHIEPFLLGFGVLLWTAGFDIIYALQDYEFDVENDLYSVAQRFGLRNALILSALVHLIAWLAFLTFWWLAGLSVFSLTGLLIMAALLIYEHSIVTPNDRSRINVAFFNVNGLISLVFLGCVWLDLWLFR